MVIIILFNFLEVHGSNLCHETNRIDRGFKVSHPPKMCKIVYENV
jgi:hypothetical protein